MIDGAHSLRPGRYGLVVATSTLARPILLGPLCGECVHTVDDIARAWVHEYRDIASPAAEVLSWCRARAVVGR